VKRLGIIRQGYSQPLFHGLPGPPLKHPEQQSPFEIVEDTPSKLVQKLRQQEVDAAFLSPIDYARQGETLRIVPHIGLISAGESRGVQLLFREHLRDIRTIAVPQQVSTSDVVLANLVLAEKHELAPQILPVSSSPKESLTKADAVLISGDDVFTVHDTHRLDLVEEWCDITDLPYVHGIWATTANGLSDSEVKLLIELTEKGVAGFQFSGPQQKWYEEYFGYHLHEDALNALTEFLRMAYYHGIMKEIVTPRFLEIEKFSRN
jgi:predicted solute-binding protein